jgi:AcrR family transcriptional regulator
MNTEPPPPPAETHRQASVRPRIGGERRTAILDAAIGVIVRRGFDTTRYQDIAEASGVAVSTLQYYFGSLESLLIETCLYASERDFATVQTGMATHPDPWDRLVYLVDIFVTGPAPGAAWQAQIEYWRASFTRPQLRAELIRDQDAWRALLVETLEEGIAQGRFRTRRDPALIAMQLNCLLDGTVFPAFTGNPAYDPATFRAATLADLAAQLHTDLSDDT